MKYENGSMWPGKPGCRHLRSCPGDPSPTTILDPGLGYTAAAVAPGGEVTSAEEFAQGRGYRATITQLHLMMSPPHSLATVLLSRGQ